MAFINLGLSRNIWNLDPRALGGCFLWVDARDSNTVNVSGSNITSLVDKSTRSTALGNVVGTWTWPNNSFNGSYPSFRATTGTTGNLGTNNLFPGGFNTGFFVANATTAGRYLIDKEPGANQFERFLVFSTGGSYPRWQTSNYFPNGGNGVSAIGIPQIISAGIDPTPFVYQNGLLEAGGTGTFGSGSYGFTLGNDRTLTSQFIGDIAEVLLFSNTLFTSGRRQAIEGYLAWKWGLQTSLPSNHPYRYMYPLVKQVDPLAISNCTLWLDIADYSTLTLSGSTVTGIRDKSGQGSDITTVVGTAPTYSSNGINGLPCISFAANGQLTGTNSNTTSNVTVVTVCTMNSGTGLNGRLLSFSSSVADDTATSNAFTMARLTTQNRIMTFRNGSVYGSNVITYDTPFVWSAQFYGAALRGYVFSNSLNGLDFPSTGGFAYNQYGIGDRIGTAASSRWFGNFGEALVFNSYLDEVTRNRVESYLANKWKLTTSLNALNIYNQKLLPDQPTFLPWLTTGLTAWWDGLDPGNNVNGVPLNGTPITSWVDKAGSLDGCGNVVRLNATGFGNPPYDASLSAISFNGSTQRYTTNLSASAATETAFVVFRADPSSTAIRTLLGSSVSGSGRRIVVSTSSTIQLNFGGPGGASGYQSTTTISSGQTYMLLTRYTSNANGVTMRINGSNQTVSTSAIVSISAGLTTNIGTSATANWLSGHMMEILVYSGTFLPLEDIYRMEGYLANKWNLRSVLPTTHPYYNFIP